MRGLDLFSGIGVASLAMQAAGIEVVGHSEIEPFPCRVLEHRFPGVPNLGDVAKITEEDLKPLGPIDVVSFGSPCQDWSVAGKRLGLKGHRSSLFHEAIRIIRLCEPRFAIFENVPGLFSSAGGWDFAAVLDEMAESGALDISWSVLDAQWFGVPQRRRRIFLVADFRGERAGEILSISEGVFRDTQAGREAWKEVARGSGGGLEESGCIRTGGDYDDPTISVDDKAFLAANPMSDRQMAVYAPEKAATPTEGSGKAGQGYPAVAHPLIARHDGSEDGRGRINLIPDLGMAVRRLTPTECERLQGVPDGWTDIPQASDSTRYRALGNAWAYPVGAWVMKGITGVAR